MGNISNRIASLSAEQRELLRRRLGQRDATGSDRQIGPRNGDRRTAPLAAPQRRLWFLARMAPASPAYNIASGVFIEGGLEPTILIRCLKEVMRRHDSLRTVFHEVNADVVQQIMPEMDLPLRTIDLPACPPDTWEAELRRLAAEETTRPFDLMRGPLWRICLVRLDEQHHALLCVMHHLIADAWSFSIFIREVQSLYQAYLDETDSRLAVLPIQYGDYAAWQQQQATLPEYRRHLDWWKQQLADLPPPLNLPTDRPQSVPRTQSGAHLDFRISVELTESLRRLSRSQPGTTLFMVLASAFQTLLLRYTGAEELVLGCATANRKRTETHGLIGPFADALVLRTDLSGNPSFAQLLGRMRNVVVDAQARDEIPLAEVVEAVAPDRRAGHTPPFQVMFSFLNLPTGVPEVGGLRFDRIELDTSTIDFDLFLVMHEDQQALRGSLGYSTDVFTAETVARMVAHFEQLLAAIVMNPERRLRELSLTTEAERMAFGDAITSPLPETLPARMPQLRIDAQAETAPSAIAVVCGEQTLDYAALKRRSDRLAHRLQTLGIEPATPVAIRVPPSPLLAIALLGLLKAGAVVACLDAESPASWLLPRLKDAGIWWVCSPDDGVSKALAAGGLSLVDLEELDAESALAEEPLPRSITLEPDAPAFMQIETGQRSPLDYQVLSSWLHWRDQVCPLTAADGVLQQGWIARFDAPSALLWPLIHGARLVLPTAEERADPALLLDRIVQQQVTVACLLPSDLARLLKATTGSMERLRCVVSGGEPLMRSVAELFFQRQGHDLISFYAPTPDKPAASWRVEPTSLRWDILPVGRPANESRIAMLDDHLEPVPVGVVGQIVLDRWASGDLARRTSEGLIELMGSLDATVWLRGFRVDLAQVEAALRQLPEVADCTLLERASDTGIELVAYVVPNGSFNRSKLADALAQILPPWMRPNSWVPIASLPLRGDGRINRSALYRLEVIDDGLLTNLEERLRAQPGGEQVTLQVRSYTPARSSLHLADILPDWQRLGDSSSQAAPTHTDAHLLADPHTNGEVRLAIAHGGTLHRPPGSPRTLADALERAVTHTPQHGIRYLGHEGQAQFQSYAALLAEAERILGGLQDLRLRPGDKLIFQLPRNEDFLPAFWACALGGFVPVPLSAAPQYQPDHANVQKIANAWDLLDRPLIITSDTLAPKLRSVSDHGVMPDLHMASIDALRTAPRSTRRHVSHPDDLALVLVTSGSTGRPKGVTQTHAALLSRSLGTIAANGFSSDDRSFNWMPLDHVGGIVMFHLLDVVAGAQQVHAPTDFILADPRRWLDCIDRFRSTVTWSPNFAYALVNEALEEGSPGHWDLSCLRFILNGGEAIVARTARRFLTLLAPYGLSPLAMHPAWGMSETCSGVTFSNRFTLDVVADDDRFVEVGAPIPEVSIRIVGQDDTLLPEGAIGRLQIAGLPVTKGYINNPELNATFFTEDGWFTTGDLGFLRDGCLTITGRESDVIIVNGINYFSHEIESVVEQVDGVEASYTAACAVRTDGSQTDQIALFFHTQAVGDETIHQILEAITQATIRHVGRKPDYLIPLAAAEIPKTAIGKIQRSLLVQRFRAGSYDSIVKRTDLLMNNQHTLPDWFFRRIWQRRVGSGVRANDSEPGTTLVFLDRQGLGRDLLAARSRSTAVVVEASHRYAQAGPSHYRIDPANPEDYRRLAAALAAQDCCITHVLHLWTYGQAQTGPETDAAIEADLRSGLYSLLWLIQAWAEHHASRVALTVVSSRAQPVLTGETVDHGKAPAIACVQALSQELDWLTARHIDLPGEDRAADLISLLAELDELPTEQEVAYRERARLVPRLEAYTPRPSAQAPGFIQGGFYLLTGGLGGIGGEIARWLVRAFNARLLIIGRTEPDALEAAGPHPDAQQARNLQLLRQSSGHVHYAAADVADLARLEAVVTEREQIWQRPLDGVIHLAGTYHEAPALEENATSLLEVLRPKLAGTLALDQLLRRRGNGWLVSFSSLTGTFGGALVLAYAAANRFLESFAQSSNGASGARRCCVSWSTWEEIGMSRGTPMRGLLRSRGYLPLTATQGIRSLQVAIASGQSHLLVGLDHGNAFVRRQLNDEQLRLEELLAVVQPINQPDRLRLPIGRDRFGTEVPLRKVRLATSEEPSGVLLVAGDGLEDALDAPRTPLEEALAAIWRDVLDVPRLSVNASFFALGGYSLLATKVVSRIRRDLGVELSLRYLFEAPTIADLAAIVEQLSTAQQEPALPPIQKIDRTQELPLSFAQQRLWFLKQLVPNDPFYNVPAAFRIRGQLSVNALILSLSEIVRRHETLRTTFTGYPLGVVPDVAGRPVQVIHPAAPVALPEIDLTPYAPNEQEQMLQNLLAAEVLRPFDLAQGPLLRASLIRQGPQDHVLLLNVHHIVFDGWSIDIFTRELGALFAAFIQGQPATLPELPIQYADFAYWQRAWFQGAILESQLNYWKRQLAEIPILELPTDHPRPAVQRFRGQELALKIPAELTLGLRDLSQREGVTLYMVLLAAFQLLLSRATNQTDIACGSPIANRRRPETEPLIGFFANTLVMRTNLAGNPQFTELLRRVRQITLEAYEHQDLPFEQLVEELQPERDLSRNPLIQVVFALQNASSGILDLPGLELTSLKLPSGAVRFDLECYLTEVGDELQGILAYNSDLFDPTTIERQATHFLTLLAGIVANPSRRIADYPLLSPDERQQILRAWSGTRQEFPTGLGVHDLFAEAARRCPDAVAVVCQDRRLSYAELEQRANQLAHHLRRRGVGSDVAVGICAERSIEMVVALLAVLKAGGAYVPLDPNYPRARIDVMLARAKVSLVLAQPPLLRLLPARCDYVPLDDSWDAFAEEPTTAPCFTASDLDLAYVIFTSGSTGQPKGVGVEHRQLVNYVHALMDRLPNGGNASFATLSTFASDLGNTAIFGALCTGGALHLLPTAVAADPQAVSSYFAQHPVDCLKIVPSHLAALLTAQHPQRVLPRTCLILGGEAASWDLIDQVHGLAPECRIFNHYGPTEATIGAVMGRVNPDDERAAKVPLGVPLANVQAYVLDASMQPTPVGVAQELYLGGAGIARGYLQQPDLTAERFVPDPFSSEPGGRLYRTGDRARFRANGELEFLGRGDDQIKIRGYRIEPSEIQAALLRYPAIRDAIVLPRTTANGQTQLVAYAALDPSRTRSLIGRVVRQERLLADHERYTLANGLTIAHLNRNETEYLYKEIFELEAYLRHGIELVDGACIVDVGANIGLFSIFASVRCNAPTVYAFEPAPPTFEVLRVNTELHGSHARLFNYGLSATAQTAELVYYPQMSFFSGLYADPARERQVTQQFMLNQQADQVGSAAVDTQLADLLDQRFGTETYTVGLKPLSDVIDAEHIQRIDLLKINAEKSELDVIRGIRDEHWPRIRQVVLEIDETEHIAPILETLRNHGFEVAVEQDMLLEGTDLCYIYARQQGSMLEAPTITASEAAAEQMPAGEEPSEGIDAHWQMVFDQVYRQAASGDDPHFNITGWNSSYTGQPIPDEQMREWVACTAARIADHQPRRILEVGCGTGLLVFALAQDCEVYRATDFSDAALRQLNQELTARPDAFASVALVQQSALEAVQVAPASFDSVILNSVVQYFPDSAYLYEVLRGAVQATTPGGVVFVGDVRSRPLLEAFHTSVVLYQADETTTVHELTQRIRQRVQEEEELVIDPDFFRALARELPMIAGVEILLKAGRAHNEMTCFRYDVVLHVADRQPGPTTLNGEILRIDWRDQALTIGELERLLNQATPPMLYLSRVPNRRVQAAIRAVDWLHSASADASVQEFRRADVADSTAVDPADLWAMGEQLGYRVAAQWCGTGSVGDCAVWFWRPDQPRPTLQRALESSAQSRALSSFMNNPGQRILNRSLLPDLYRQLRRQLPDYMVPAAVVLLDHLPRTDNGKIDRLALPIPDPTEFGNNRPYAAPRTTLEQQLAMMWSHLLGIERIGVHDNFFESGGHSLLAVQFLSRVRSALNIDLPLQQIFEQPTIAQLAETITTLRWLTTPTDPDGSFERREEGEL